MENFFNGKLRVESGENQLGERLSGKGREHHEWSEEIPTAITMFNDTGEYCFPYVSASLILIIFVE
jgi:hypothetical protein